MPTDTVPAGLETNASVFLQGLTASVAEFMDLAGRLKSRRSFGYARRLFGLARLAVDIEKQPELGLRLAQEEALCTYQDPDQPATARLDRALEILSSIENLRTTRNQETLGLTGAIYKRRWEAGARGRSGMGEAIDDSPIGETRADSIPGE